MLLPSLFRLGEKVLRRQSSRAPGHGGQRKSSRGRTLGFESLEIREMLSAGAVLGGLAERWPQVAALATQAAARPAASAQAAFVPADRYEYDDLPMFAKSISTDGRTQSHTISTARDTDWVKFTLTARSNVVIQTDGPAGDTEMALFGPNNSTSQIAYDNDGNGKFSRIERSGAGALDPGTYYVRVNEFGRNQTIAGYTIGVQATPPAMAPDGYEPDNTAAQAHTILVDQGPERHNLHTGADVDWVKFTLGARSDVLIETRGTTGDTRITLFGPTDPSTQIAVDDNTGVGDFSLILRSGPGALAPGDYYAKVEAANSQPIAQYTLSVMTLQPGDVLLVQGSGGLPNATRFGEARELGVPTSATYSHAALYLGNNEVAEMLAQGFAITPLPNTFSGNSLVDVCRDPLIGSQGPAVAAAARTFAGTGYAYMQYTVLGQAAVNPGRPDQVRASVFYSLYGRLDRGVKRMICSELVARAYAAAGVTLRVSLWPTMRAIGDTSQDFLMDFTTPTMLSLSPDLRRLNA